MGNMIDETIYNKVLRECESSLLMTERRLVFIKSTHKSQRPVFFAEIVESWEKAIEDFKSNIK